jgi:hypothetical protein
VDAIKVLIPFLKPEVEQRNSSTLAKVVMKKPPPLPEVPIDLCRLKVCEPTSSCQCGAVGRNGDQFGAP